MAFGDSDLSVFTADFGVAVEFGGSTAQGNFDAPQKNLGGDSGFGGVDTSIPRVHLPFNAFSPMPQEEQTVTVDGTDYLVGAVTAEGDGKFVCIDLKAVS